MITNILPAAPPPPPPPPAPTHAQACQDAGMLDDIFTAMRDAGHCELMFLVLLHGKRLEGAWQDARQLFYTLQ